MNNVADTSFHRLAQELNLKLAKQLEEETFTSALHIDFRAKAMRLYRLIITIQKSIKDQ